METQQKSNPLFEKFLNKNPFIQTIDLNKRKQLLKAFSSKKNTLDFNNLLIKLYSHFQIQSKNPNNLENIENFQNLNEKSSIFSEDEKNTRNNSFFQIPDSENIDDLKESEISDQYYKKTMYEDREIWESLNPRELEIKKQLAVFNAKIFILEKKSTHFKVSNQELEEQNHHYEAQVQSLMIERSKAEKEKKGFDKKIEIITENFKVSDEIYTTLRHFLNRNIEEINSKAYNKAHKALLHEKKNEEEKPLINLPEPVKTKKIIKKL